jgi:tetratricopeptide (TPR) repeat protein
MGVRGELHFVKDNEESILPLDAPRFTIGRDAENSHCLADGVVSRYHAELIRLGNDFLLRDLGSTNGSFVNGARVSEQMLNDGDVVRFGKAGPELVFKQIESTGEIEEPARHRWSTTENLIDSLAGKLDGLSGDSAEEVNLRCILAEAHLNKGHYDEALAVLAKYEDSARLLAVPPQFRATVLLWSARAQIESKQYSAAIDALHRSLELYTQAGDYTGIAAAHASLGRALSSTGELLAARDNLHRATLMARRAGNARLRAEVHLVLGKVDWTEGDLEGARYNWTRAARLAEGTNDALLQAKVQFQQAFLLASDGNVKDAVPAYQAAIDQIEAVGNLRMLLKAYSGLSRLLTRSGSWAATERLLEDRLRLARDNRLDKAEAVALTDLAELRLLQGNLTAAGNVIEAALERHGGTVYARTQRILGRILSARGQPADAIEALETGLAAASRKGTLEEQILIGLELAIAYSEAREPARAREHLDTAESITSLDPALNLLGRALYARGRLFAAAEQVAEANRSFTQALSIFQNIGDPFRTGVCHTAIGELRTRMGRAGSARAHLEEAQRIFTKLGAAGELRSVNDRLRSGAFDNVEAAMTRTLPRSLSMTAPLSMANVPTVTQEAMAVEPVPFKILIAAANEELAAVLAKGLEVENYVVDRVQDGREALGRALGRDGAYHMLLLDALLEHRSGFDVCRELRRRNRETPVILLGGRQGVEDKIEALQAGADDFIGKRNMVFEELLAKMEALLR